MTTLLSPVASVARQMPRLVKCGLIQASHACSTAEKLETIRDANLAKHMGLI